MSAAHKRSQETREEKEYTIHNPKYPTGLQHRTRLVYIQIIGVPIRLEAGYEGIGVALGGDGRTGVGRDAAQVVDAGYEGADEAEVDEGDKVGVGA